MSGDGVLPAALDAAGHGFHVFPVQGKTPLSGLRWKERATTDPQVIVSDFAGSPATGYGIACGPSNLLVIDEDEPGAFAVLARKHGQSLPETMLVRTGRGFHWYFRPPEGLVHGNGVGVLKGRGLDVRGAGGYVVGPGSRHMRSGAVYELITNGTPIAVLPPWLATLLKAPQVAADDAFDRREGFHLPDIIVDHTRHQTIVALCGQLREQGTSLENALLAVQAAWGRCVQPPEAQWTYPLKAALDTCRDVYRRYAGPARVHVPTGDEAKERDYAGYLRDAVHVDPPAIVERLLPVGLYWLSGPPKLGKSYLALNIAVAVAAGRDVLNRPTKQGRVLYCALEDGLWRTKKRAAQIDGHDAIGLDALIVRPALPTIGDEFFSELDEWIARDPGSARLIVLDLFARIRPDNGKGSAYTEDYKSVAPLQPWATRNEVAVLLVHHTRKGSADADPTDALSGTLALLGAADGQLSIRGTAGQQEVRLDVSSRDMEDVEPMVIAKAGGMWVLSNMPSELAAGGHYKRNERQVWRLLEEHGERTPQQLAAALGITETSVSRLMHRMLGEGWVDQCKGPGHAIRWIAASGPHR